MRSQTRVRICELKGPLWEPVLDDLLYGRLVTRGNVHRSQVLTCLSVLGQQDPTFYITCGQTLIRLYFLALVNRGLSFLSFKYPNPAKGFVLGREEDENVKDEDKNYRISVYSSNNIQRVFTSHNLRLRSTSPLFSLFLFPTTVST